MHRARISQKETVSDLFNMFLKCFIKCLHPNQTFLVASEWLTQDFTDHEDQTNYWHDIESLSGNFFLPFSVLLCTAVVVAMCDGTIFLLDFILRISVWLDRREIRLKTETWFFFSFFNSDLNASSHVAKSFAISKFTLKCKMLKWWKL